MNNLQRAPKTTYCPLVAAESLSFMYKQCICGTVALYGPFFLRRTMQIELRISLCKNLQNFNASKQCRDFLGPRYIGDNFLRVESSLIQSNSRCSLRDRLTNFAILFDNVWSLKYFTLFTLSVMVNDAVFRDSKVNYSFHKLFLNLTK
jgi:hypothetical protein